MVDVPQPSSLTLEPNPFEQSFASKAPSEPSDSATTIIHGANMNTQPHQTAAGAGHTPVAPNGYSVQGTAPIGQSGNSHQGAPLAGAQHGSAPVFDKIATPLGPATALTAQQQQQQQQQQQYSMTASVPNQWIATPHAGAYTPSVMYEGYRAASSAPQSAQTPRQTQQMPAQHQPQQTHPGSEGAQSNSATHFRMMPYGASGTPLPQGFPMSQAMTPGMYYNMPLDSPSILVNMSHPQNGVVSVPQHVHVQQTPQQVPQALHQPQHPVMLPNTQLPQHYAYPAPVVTPGGTQQAVAAPPNQHPVENQASHSAGNPASQSIHQDSSNGSIGSQRSPTVARSASTQLSEQPHSSGSAQPASPIASTSSSQAATSPNQARPRKRRNPNFAHEKDPVTFLKFQSASKVPKHEEGDAERANTAAAPASTAPAEGDASDKEAALRRSATSDDEARRQLFLERNRIAAVRCRQRKKQWVDDLKTKIETYSHITEDLQTRNNRLVSDLAQLKQFVIRSHDVRTLPDGVLRIINQEQ